MATKTLITEEKYLRTSFEGPDCEYKDGEVLERGMPTYLHGLIQLRLGALFLALMKSHNLYPSSEARHRVRPGLVRIPDVAVHLGMPVEAHPDSAPYVAIEILSPDDRMGDLVQKLREYRSFGAAHVWAVDPDDQTLYVYDSDGLHQVRSLQIPEFGINFSSAQIFEK
jgi:Uma2 family endonuclease